MTGGGIFCMLTDHAMVCPMHFVQRLRTDLGGIAAAVFTVLCSVPAAAEPAAEELKARREIGRMTQAPYHGKRFVEIEQMAEGFRVSKARTPSGVWQLTVFYAELEFLYGECCVRDHPKGYGWERLDQWLAEFPESPTAHIMKAYALRSLALTHDPKKYTGQLPHSGWQPDIAFMAEARKVLEAAKPFASRDPHYYTVLIEVMRASGASLDDILLVHDEAATREPLYYQTSFVALRHLMTATGFNEKMVTAFANTVHERTKALEGESAYARLFWSAYEHNYGLRLFASAPVDWNRMKAGMTRVLADYPVAWNGEHFALFACLRGDRALAGEMFRRFPGPAVKEVWPLPAVHESCQTWAGR